MKITKKQLRRLIKEAIMSESPSRNRVELLKQEFDEIPGGRTDYPYGRNRGDVKSNKSYQRKDGTPISPEEFEILKSIEVDNHPLSGMYTHTLSDDGMTLHVKYYRHTAG